MRNCRGALLSWSFTARTIGSATRDGNAPAAPPPVRNASATRRAFRRSKLGPYGLQDVAITSSGLGLVDPYYKRNLDVVQQDSDRTTLRRWSLSRAWPTKFVAGEWDNESDENVIAQRMAFIIHCPSGLTGTIRGLKVREERVLADRKLQKAGSIVDDLLRACWEETHDAGPYDFEGAKIDWNKVLQGDRFFALLEIRALTDGAEYAFAVTCREDGCRARIDWELDLRKLPVRALSGATSAGPRPRRPAPIPALRARRWPRAEGSLPWSPLPERVETSGVAGGGTGAGET